MIAFMNKKDTCRELFDAEPAAGKINRTACIHPPPPSDESPWTQTVCACNPATLYDTHHECLTRKKSKKKSNSSKKRLQVLCSAFLTRIVTH